MLVPPTHKLVIIDPTGNTCEIHGDISLGQVWQTWSEGDFEPTGKLVVRGVTDCYSMRPVLYALDHSLVKGMILVEL